LPQTFETTRLRKPVKADMIRGTAVKEAMAVYDTLNCTASMLFTLR
jgi:hypothetical protein